MIQVCFSSVIVTEEFLETLVTELPFNPYAVVKRSVSVIRECMETEKVWMQEFLELRFCFDRMLADSFNRFSNLILFQMQEFIEFVFRIWHLGSPIYT